MSRLVKWSIGMALGVFVGSGLSLFAFAAGVEIFPMAFDFGWCPDNAKVSCEFQLRNTSEDFIPVTHVQPTCGCTATDFTPADLSSDQEMTIGMTFNTRGYHGRTFNKKTHVKTGDMDEQQYVSLMGHVRGESAPVHPLGSGIAAFDPNTRKRTQTMSILNKLKESVNLQVVQAPAEWVRMNLSGNTIKPGATVNLDISVKPPYDEKKHSSVTFEAMEGDTPHRFTVAIRTGPSPASKNRFQSPLKR